MKIITFSVMFTIHSVQFTDTQGFIFFTNGRMSCFFNIQAFKTTKRSLGPRKESRHISDTHVPLEVFHGEVGTGSKVSTKGKEGIHLVVQQFYLKCHFLKISGRFQTAAVITALFNLISDDDPNIRAVAALALAKTGE